MRTIVAILAGIAIYIYAQLGLEFTLEGYGLTPYIVVPMIILILAMTTVVFHCEHQRFMLNLSN